MFIISPRNWLLCPHPTFHIADFISRLALFIMSRRLPAAAEPTGFFLIHQDKVGKLPLGLQKKLADNSGPLKSHALSLDPQKELLDWPEERDMEGTQGRWLAMMRKYTYLPNIAGSLISCAHHHTHQCSHALFPTASTHISLPKDLFGLRNPLYPPAQWASSYRS